MYIVDSSFIYLSNSLYTYIYIDHIVYSSFNPSAFKELSPPIYTSPLIKIDPGHCNGSEHLWLDLCNEQKKSHAGEPQEVAR